MTHLRVLAHDHSVIPWSDDRIGAGEDWEEVIRRAIDKARVAILLISANFLTSKFILQDEVPRILKRRQADGLTVVPLIAKPCAWHEHEWLATLGAKPKQGTPVWRDGGELADQELAEIAREIAKMLRPGR